MRRLPGLDGIRALSIVLVLAGHAFPFSARWYVGELANLGVRCFFVLSGFLITTLLLGEFQENGAIALGKFYARRTLRIFPAFYAFLLVLFLAERLALVPGIDASSWIHAFTYTMDYVGLKDRPWNLGHIWSLAVEEQFYLLWPTALALLRPRKGMWLAVAAILVVPIIRWSTWRFFPQYAGGIKWQFHTVCDALASGCLLAGVRHALWTRPAYRRWLTSRAFIVVPIGVLLVNRIVVGRPQVNYLVGQTVMNLGIALCIDYVLRHHDGVVGRLLELRPVVFVGTLSYSIYLWQQLFFNPQPQAWICRFPFNVLATLAAAWLSYTLIERPFLSLRHRFAAPQGPPGLEAPPVVS